MPRPRRSSPIGTNRPISRAEADASRARDYWRNPTNVRGPDYLPPERGARPGTFRVPLSGPATRRQPNPLGDLIRKYGPQAVKTFQRLAGFHRGFRTVDDVITILENVAVWHRYPGAIAGRELYGWEFYRNGQGSVAGRARTWYPDALPNSTQTGQAFSTGYPSPEDAAAASSPISGYRYVSTYQRTSFVDPVRWSEVWTWRKPASAPSASPATWRQLDAHFNADARTVRHSEWWNPNYIRWAEVTPQPLYGPAPVPLAPPSMLRPPRQSWEVSPLRKPGAKPRRQPRRKKEGKRTKETKFTSKWRKLGMALAAAMDVISEASEIVDALWATLPKYARSDCDRKAYIVDQFGQYGVDNADCKLKDLWNWWPEVNSDEAIRNIVKNAIEDLIIGGKHKALPANWSNNSKEADQEFGKWVNDTLDEYISSDTEQDFLSWINERLLSMGLI